MRPTLRTAVLASAILSLAGSTPLLAPGVALAQAAHAATDAASGNEQPPKQVQLTQQIVDNLVAAQKALQPIEGKMPQDGAADDKPDPKLDAQIDAAVKKSGFADDQAYADASYSVGLVLAGMDPDSGDYIGAKAAIQKQIKDLDADKKMPAKEKKEALAELNEAMKSTPDEKPLDGNVALVKKNFDKLNQAMPQSD